MKHPPPHVKSVTRRLISLDLSLIVSPINTHLVDVIDTITSQDMWFCLKSLPCPMKFRFHVMSEFRYILNGIIKAYLNEVVSIAWTVAKQEIVQ